MMKFLPAKKTKKPEQKQKMMWLDWLFIGGFLFNISALLSTYFIVGLINHTTGTTVGNALEANPINELLLHIPILQITMYVILWGFVGYSYILERKEAFTSDKKMMWFTFFVITLSLLLFMDMINDISLVAKVLIA